VIKNSGQVQRGNWRIVALHPSRIGHNLGKAGERRKLRKMGEYDKKRKPGSYSVDSWDLQHVALFHNAKEKRLEKRREVE
jgi:hypothetical protein